MDSVISPWPALEVEEANGLVMGELTSSSGSITLSYLLRNERVDVDSG